MKIIEKNQKLTYFRMIRVQLSAMENPFQPTEINLRTKYERWIFLAVSVIVLLVIIVLIIIREIQI